MKQFVFLIVAFFTTITLPAQRQKYNFNPGWKVFVGNNADAYKNDFDDSRWKNVTLPYAWNEDEGCIRLRP